MDRQEASAGEARRLPLLIRLYSRWRAVRRESRSAIKTIYRGCQWNDSGRKARLKKIASVQHRPHVVREKSTRSLDQSHQCCDGPGRIYSFASKLGRVLIASWITRSASSNSTPISSSLGGRTRAL